MGKGELYSTPHKQNLNMKISTETDLVATDDVMPQLLWKMFFWRLRRTVLGHPNYTRIT